MSTLTVKEIEAPTGYDLVMPAGSVIQFASKNLNSGSWTTTSTSYVSTDATIDFTPKFASSTILVHFFGSVHYSINNHGLGQIRKNGSTLTATNQRYDHDDFIAYHANTTPTGGMISGFWAGDAGSTSQATYAYYVAAQGGGTLYFYRNFGISVTEIAG